MLVSATADCCRVDFLLCASDASARPPPPSRPHCPSLNPLRPRFLLLLPACQLFMVPPLRKAILEARFPRRKLEDNPKELVGRRVALQWEAGGVMEAFVVSYNEQTGEILVSVWRGSLY